MYECVCVCGGGELTGANIYGLGLGYSGVGGRVSVPHGHVNLGNIDSILSATVQTISIYDGLENVVSSIRHREPCVGRD